MAGGAAPENQELLMHPTTLESYHVRSINHNIPVGAGF